MNMIPKIIFMLLLISSLLLNGCGGGSVFAEGGMGGTGISTGTVTDIGSIKVNGVTFDTNKAAIYIEGNRVDDPVLPDGDRDSLLSYGFSEGQVVRVVGDFNEDGRTGTADAVYYNDTVEGPVESVTPIDASTQADASVLQLVVMGQAVIVDSQTSIEGTALTNIGNAGHDEVEVSGLRDSNGQIRAGYVRNTLASDPDGSSLDEIKGVIDSINASLTQFTINSLVVDYSNLPAFTPQLNWQVEVKGDYVGGQLMATSIELEDDIDGLDDDDVEYEGIVKTAPVPYIEGNNFVMGVQIVQTIPNITVYKGGFVEDIVNGVRLEVEGQLQGGILLADEVHFRDAIEVDAPVVSHAPVPLITPDTITITLNLGTDTLEVLVNDLSKLTGDAEGFTLTQLDTVLSNDDYVEVRGRVLDAGPVFAEEIKIIDGGTKLDVKLQGPAEDPLGDPLVTILGITINVDVEPINEYQDANDNPIDRTTFFNTVANGNIVSAEGVLDGIGGIDWDKLEIEDEE